MWHRTNCWSFCRPFYHPIPNCCYRFISLKQLIATLSVCKTLFCSFTILVLPLTSYDLLTPSLRKYHHLNFSQSSYHHHCTKVWPAHHYTKLIRIDLLVLTLFCSLSKKIVIDLTYYASYLSVNCWIVFQTFISLFSANHIDLLSFEIGPLFFSFASVSENCCYFLLDYANYWCI